MGEGGNACLLTPQFRKTSLPMNRHFDWCSVVYLIDRFDMKVSNVCVKLEIKKTKMVECFKDLNHV